jgi:hypothetical protein
MGVGNVSKVPNMSWTAAIDVLFSIHFAVVFDFIYFRFRPIKGIDRPFGRGVESRLI